MRVVGLDIHRVFAEAVMLENGAVRRLGRIASATALALPVASTTTRDRHGSAFARTPPGDRASC